MGGEREEIAVELLHIDGHMGDRLRAIDDHVRSSLMRRLGDPLDGVEHAEHVRDVHDGDDLGLRPDLRGDLFIRDDALVVRAQVDERGACGTAGLLPGDEVAVVLHDGDADLVARFEHGGCERLGRHIEGFRRVAAEDDLVRFMRADEFRGLLAGIADGHRRFERQLVQPAQGVRVHGLVERTLGIQHDGGPLGRGRRVEERELGVQGKQREIAAERAGGKVGRIERYALGAAHCSTPS